MFEARLDADEYGVLWLRDASGGARYQLAVVLQGGWRVAASTLAERALLDAHGVVQSGY